MYIIWIFTLLQSLILSPKVMRHTIEESVARIIIGIGSFFVVIQGLIMVATLEIILQRVMVWEANYIGNMRFAQ